MRKVYEIMSRNVVVSTPGESLATAYTKMKTFGIRHLPVMRGESVVGILSVTDVLLSSELVGGELKTSEQSVAEVMSGDVVSCSPSSYVATVAATMLACKIACMPVLKKHSMVGIITSSDLLDSICMDAEEFGQTVIPTDFIERGGLYPYSLRARQHVSG